MDGDLAEGDADVGEELARDIDLAAARAGAGGDGSVLGGDLLARFAEREAIARDAVARCLSLGRRLGVSDVDIHCGGLLREEVRRRGMSAPTPGVESGELVPSPA